MISLLRANLDLDIPIHLTMRIRKGDNIYRSSTSISMNSTYILFGRIRERLNRP